MSAAGQICGIEENELLRMLAFHISAGARQISKLAGQLQSPQLRREMADLIAELAWAKQKVEAWAESEDVRSATRPAPPARNTCAA